MVHKLYADRVQDFLYRANALDDRWSTIRDEHDSCKIPMNAKSIFQRNVQLLATPTLSGVSKARRGYVLLLLTQVPRNFVELSPFARQNISFVARITHEITSATLSNGGIGEEIWKCQNAIANAKELDKLLLRVDCFPRELTEDICLQLQRAAASPQNSIINHPFEGPIAMTKSKSKCTHRLVVIFCNDKFFWGFENRRDHSELMEVKLNHEAADEIQVQPADSNLVSKTGTNDIENLQVPVSRAYYKLAQVWEEYLDNLSVHFHFTAGCDLGASPGGWTQVLVHRAKLSKVIAIDAAQLASCVAQLPQTIHVPKEMEKVDLDEFLARNENYSVVVCDASANANEIQPIILQSIQTTQKWAVPAAVVVTMKFPFKTIGSIQRHISKVLDSLPEFLSNMRGLMYQTATASNISIRYRLEHVMANSDSERTLIALFEKET
jgi:predicted rRNA methylase YqxC with S4 and FtsJ domains